MATPSSEDNIKWSDETFSIRDVAYNNLPTVVKVADGYYSENEAESFSNGDLIKLDFKKSYSKVRAQCVGGTPKEDISGYMSPDRDILIPLGYKGKLKVECLKSTFNSVQELIEHFPHFVITGRPLIGKRGVYSQEEFRIEKGVKLQLERVIPEAGLVCKLDGKECLLASDQLARFHLERDERQYTIREVIDNFVLPQYIRFLDSDFEKIVTSDLTEAIDNISQFQGYLKLLGLVQQEVVVGHHKPSGVAATEAGNASQRAIAILPLDSESVRNIEVYLPVYEEDNDYEFFLARNFSTNVNLDLVDGGLYLEFQKNPRIHLLNTEAEEKAPPRPPPPPQYVNRKDLPERDTPHPSDRGSPVSQTKERKKWRKPPSIPQHTDTVHSPTSPDGVRGGGGGPLFSNTKDTKGRLNRGDIPPPAPRPKPKPKPPTPVQKNKAKLHAKNQQDSDEDEGAYEEMRVVGRVKPFPHKPPLTKEPTRVMPHVSFADESSDSDKENPYDEIEEVQDLSAHDGENYSKKTGLDFTKLPKTFRHGLKKVHLELKKLKRTRSTDLKSTTSTEDLHVLPSKKDLNPLESSSDDDDEPVLYDYPDLTKLASMPRPKPISDVPRYQDSLKVKPAKPVGKIQPIARETYGDKKFSELTSEEVVNLFKMTTLPALASACEREGLDGSFLCSLSDTQLKKVFKLSDLQIIKVNKIINDGWRPNTN